MGWQQATRGEIPPMKYIKEVTLDGTTTSVQGGSIPLGPDSITGCSFNTVSNQSGTATLVATTLVEASGDPRAMPGHPDYADALWADVSSEFALTAITTAAGDTMDNVSNIRYPFIRVKLTRSSGSGPAIMYFTGHGTGG